MAIPSALMALLRCILLVQACCPVHGFSQSAAHHDNHPKYSSSKSSHLLQNTKDNECNHAAESSLPDRRSIILGTMSSLLFTTSLPPSSPASGTNTNTNTIPEWTLPNNVKFPTLALNTAGLSAKDATHALDLAVKSGVTHVDFHPGKERDGVAAYITSHGRQQLFLNTKIRKAAPGTKPSDAALMAKKQIEDDLNILGVANVDMLMLRDSPDGNVMQAQWKVMEEALKLGKTRSIGVVNYCQKSLECILEIAEVQPAINYYMLHVGMGKDAHGLRGFGESKGIKTFAYGALGEPGPNRELLNSPLLSQIGVKYDKRPEEVALRWVLQSGAAVSVRPTTNFGLGMSLCSDKDTKCEAGMMERASTFSWSLSAKEMDELDSLNSPDDNPTLFSSSGCPNAFGM